MKMSILNIIISFFLFIQFSLGGLGISFNMHDISKVNESQSVQECGDGCKLIKFLFWERCICPPKPKTNLP